MNEIIAGRTISAFPISVGTSLALESVLSSPNPSIDPDREIPQKVNLVDYDDIWINISTLFRNLFGSLTKEGSKRVLPRELAQGLIEEIEFIHNLVATETLNRTKSFFYICQYKDLNSLYPYAIFRQDHTELQKTYRALHDNAIQFVLQYFGKQDYLKIFNSEIKPVNYSKALIITHVAHDLLSYKNFNELHLLESHTGVLKKKHQWNTKYTEGKSLPMLPFNKGLLQIFGDSETFRPFPINTRKSILELANKYKWTPATTKDKIILNLDQLPDKFSVSVLKSVFR